MEKSKLKLLLNAEPFGFGPTAAIATFFPYIRENFEHLGYLGKNHTLDLQKNLPYDSIHDVSGLSDEEIKKILTQYDVFCTALDFETASLAKAAGLKVVIYDPLTWYWKSIPQIVSMSDLYLTQDFFGVGERLQHEPKFFPKDVRIIAPIVSAKRPRISKRYTLINLGGLQNPFWSADEVVHYSRIFIKAIKECISPSEHIIIATSNAVALKLADEDVKNYSRSEIHEILQNTKYAFMTPGLGNIYDVAKFDIPPVWLPPANDSQGQQLDLLKSHSLSDGEIDWSDIGMSIDYRQEQPVVLQHIKDAIYSVTDTAVLKNKIRAFCNDMNLKDSSLTTKLIDEFGTGGAEAVGKLLYEYCQSL